MNSKIQVYANLVFGAKKNSAILKQYDCEKIKKLLYDEFKIWDYFSVILMGIRFSEVYSVLDNIEFDRMDG